MYNFDAVLSKLDTLTDDQRKKLASDMFVAARKRDEFLEDDMNGKHEVFKSLLNPAFEEVDVVEEKVNPYTWGTVVADKHISPLQPHHYVVFSGATGSGKTAYSSFLAMQNAIIGHKVLYLSLEMSASEIVTRMARAAAGMSKEQWRIRDFSPVQLDIYHTKKSEIRSNTNLKFCGLYGKTETGENITATLENIWKIYEYSECDLLFVDNFDLIVRDSNKTALDNERDISKFFMDKTSAEKKPVIMIHHLNKMGVLRGSQKIIDDCDIFLLGTRTEASDDLENSKMLKAQYQVLQAKDRDFGENDFVMLYFKGGKFYDTYQN